MRPGAADVSSSFNEELVRIERAGVRRAHAALKEPITGRVLALLDRYQHRLPGIVLQEVTLDAGRLLCRFHEHEAALRHCFEPVMLATCDDNGLGTEGLVLRVRSELCVIESSFALLRQRDASLDSKSSVHIPNRLQSPLISDLRPTNQVLTLATLLDRLRHLLEICVKQACYILCVFLPMHAQAAPHCVQESLYWLVFNGTVTTYHICSAAMLPVPCPGASLSTAGRVHRRERLAERAQLLL